VSAPVPERALETSADSPWPVRLLSTKMAAYIDKMPPVWVEGQVIQLVRRPGTTMAYLTLRDADADCSLPVTALTRVLDAIGAPLAEGARVVVHARPTFWAKRGTLQLSAREIRPIGLGELLARIEQLKAALAGEGLFAADRKRPLPFVPRRVGLICGRASAAERDVIDNARRRWPAVEFELREVAVQGPSAASQVTAALVELDALPEIDVIVITRGGGSLEDLLPFSSEPLIRAVAAAHTPIVSAIGHEVDTPLLDLVADVRASTPTDAAKRIVPDLTEELASLDAARERLRRTLRLLLDRQAQGLLAVRSRPSLAQPESMIAIRRDEISAARQGIRLRATANLDRAQDNIRHLTAQVRGLSPAATLRRGYAVVQQCGDGRLVRAPADAPLGAQVRIRLADGELAAVIDSP
jgi:exodeoxyribonuclease VII large subunit